jgi:hypothetical protein
MQNQRSGARLAKQPPLSRMAESQMPDEKWLQNEPQSWHDINRALQDISLLLTYLGKLSGEGRLSFLRHAG